MFPGGAFDPPAQGGPDHRRRRVGSDLARLLADRGASVAMTLALAQELAPHVMVNRIQPAMVDPPPHFSEHDRAAVVAQTPLQRVGTPDDVNRLILYLLEGTNFVTGSCYRVDGGRFLGMDT
jgi:pteridine reductase